MLGFWLSEWVTSLPWLTGFHCYYSVRYDWVTPWFPWLQQSFACVRRHKPGFHGLIPSRGKGFTSLPNRPNRLWGPPSCLFHEYRWLPAWGVRRPGREADHSPASCAEVKNERSYTSIPPYAFDRDNVSLVHTIWFFVCLIFSFLRLLFLSFCHHWYHSAVHTLNLTTDDVSLKDPTRHICDIIPTTTA